MKDKFLYTCELDAETGSKLEILLYKDVKNVKELRKLVMDGSLKCCIIKASLICHPFQIVVAANKALLAATRNVMTTRTIYSEILFNLSLSKNITQSLTTFGIDDNETNLTVVIVDQNSSEDIKANVIKLIDGEQCPIEEFKSFTDVKLIEKTYKIKGTDKNQLLDIIVSKMATKDFISH